MTLVTRHLLCPVGGKLGQVLVRAPAAAGSPSFFSSLSCVSVPPPLCAVSIPRTSAEKLVEANRPPRPVRGEDRRRLSGRRRQVEKSADASRALQLPCGAAAARSSSPPKLLPSLASASPFSRYLASAPRAAPLLQSPVLSSSSLSHDRPFSMSIASSPALASPLCRPRFFSLTVQVSSEKGGGREGSEDEGTTSEQPSGGRDSFEREGVLAKAGRLLHRAVPAAWKALERRQLEMLLPKYIFDDSLSEDPLLGMRIMEFRDTPREALQAHRDEIDARLKAFAGDIDPFAFVRDDVESLDLSLLSSVGLPSRWVTWSADFGACVGMAFQLYDDELDFTASSENLGKPALNDLRSGLVTAPLLMAALEEEARGASAGGEARTILERRADREGDVEKAIKLIFASDAMPRSQLMGRLYVRRATELLEELTAEIGTSSLGGSDGDAAKKAAIPDACRALAALLQATLQRRS